MRILGIETSCDDTAIGIVTVTNGSVTIESQITASQALIHRKYGGVVPEVAAREHALTIIPTIHAALAAAKTDWQEIDALAVTAGPGLSTALNVGVEAGRALAYALKKPIVAVNHIEGHLLSPWADAAMRTAAYPMVALIVSGGHTELILVTRPGVYQLLGKTIDDAVGEAFDKVAKVLGLPYPGGPEISRQAKKGHDARFRFPRSMLGRDSLDFSYAGLKTSVLYEYRRHARVGAAMRADMAASFQRAAIDPLVEKTRRAILRTKARTLLLAGGVAANGLLRDDLAALVAHDFPKALLVRAPIGLCADNGVMIAIAGSFHAERGAYTHWRDLRADPGWELVR